MQIDKRRRRHRRKVEIYTGILFVSLLLVIGLVIYGIFSYGREDRGAAENMDNHPSTYVLEKEEIEAESSDEVITDETVKEESVTDEVATEDVVEYIEQEENDLPAVETEETIEVDRAEQILREMTLEEKVAQMFFLTPELLTGVSVVTAAGDTTKKALEEYPVGGLVYYKQNLIDWQQTENMLSYTQEVAMEQSGLPIFLAIDEEGGRVLRIGNNSAYGVEMVQPMGELAKQNNPELIYKAGNTIGSYLHDLGFNVDFAPDADVLTNEENNVIGNRSFGKDPVFVAQMSWEYARGLNDQNVCATYKHFPGHGGTMEDSHTGKAYLYKSLEELKTCELVPFQDGVQKGVDFIMISHISIPDITRNDTPASLSEMLVTDILRKDMGYEGIIITDSLRMKAVSGFYSASEAAVEAVLAGNDMLLMPSDFKSAYAGLLQAVDQGVIEEERIDESVYRIIKKKLAISMK